mmetsp:Transcript_104537/g.300522  ORF Transcript_104537/g.300522 Transcript_104537/m.300522 type:complete len:305 (-) Transcript_104537:263-1177(-)
MVGNTRGLARGRSRRGPAALLWVAAAAVAWQISNSARAFLAPPRSSRGGAALVGSTAQLDQARALRGSSRITRHFFGQIVNQIVEAVAGPVDMDAERKNVEKILYPEETSWKMTSDGRFMRDYYTGGRSFGSMFWAVVQPTCCILFMIVGVSTLRGPLIDDIPFVNEYMWWLRPTTEMHWIPQGFFMSFWGFFGFLFLVPINWYLQYTNAGAGVIEVDKQLRKFTIVRDDELLEDIDFERIEKVVCEYGALTIQNNEMYIVTKDMREIHFMDGMEPITKRQLERKAAELSEFIGVDLEVDAPTG